MGELAKLNDKHRLFVEHYTNIGAPTYLNATKSYIQAGYEGVGVGRSAHRLLKKDEIQECIRESINQHLIDVGVEKNRILTGIAEIAEDPMATKAERLKAYEMLGKFCNIFDKHEQAKAPKIQINYATQINKG